MEQRAAGIGTPVAARDEKSCAEVDGAANKCSMSYGGLCQKRNCRRTWNMFRSVLNVALLNVCIYV